MRLKNILLGLAIAGFLFAADPVIDQAKKKIADKKYDEAITSLESAYKTKPASVDLKKALADAYMAKADYFMTAESVPPRQKYPEALRSYRKVLTYDKENAKAKQNIAMIEDIYKSMGRPVPQ